ncbi:MAG: hypothetical protein LUG18_09625 [Candidatus Azobacteroides sp.]|nr:hypothetical protein [Candidatus Azobacteroides sp.]
MMEIADLCGINKNLTTQLGRNTTAMVIFFANDVSMEKTELSLAGSFNF